MSTISRVCNLSFIFVAQSLLIIFLMTLCKFLLLVWMIQMIFLDIALIEISVVLKSYIYIYIYKLIA